MPTLPRFTEQSSLSDVPYLINGLHTVGAEDVTFSSGQTSSLTPDHRHPPGTVLAFRTSSSEYELADSANADSNSAATVRTLITNPGAGGWDGNIVLTAHWGTLTVALSGDDTDAAVAAKIIAAAAAANPESAAPVTSADEVADSVVSITNFDTGVGTWLKATHSAEDTVFGADGVDDEGDDVDIRVTTGFNDLKDIDGNAIDALAGNIWAGHFDESELASLTAEAKTVLQRRGSRFS